MVDIIWLIICIAIGGPMIVTPQKMTDRPNSKIKSTGTIRILGVVIVLLGAMSLLFNML